MAHMVENMMYVGERPWHGLGQSLPLEVTATEALAHAGLDWLVSLRPVFAKSNDPGAPFAAISGYSAVVRESDNFPLGVVSKKYTPIQNRDVASLADAIAGEGQALCHTAGSLDHGRRIWFLLKLPGEIKVGLDSSPVEKHLLLTTTHDGSGTYRVLFTPIRVVCANTLNLALSGEGGISIRHTANAQAQVEAAKAAMQSVLDFYQRFDILAQSLANTAFGEPDMEELAEFLYPAPNRPEEDKKTETEADKTINKTIIVKPIHPIILKNRERLVELFSEGREHRSIQGTAWAALNAVVEYVDHWRPTRATDGASKQENRLQSIWFGTGADMKSRALSKIGEQTGIALAA